MTLDSRLKELGISDADFAQQHGVSAEAVRLWRKGLRRMSPDTAKAIEQKTGIPRHELRPDLWEPPAAASQDAA